MLTKTGDVQSKIEVVVIDNLIQEDHILKKIDKHIDFNFIYERQESLKV